MTRNDYLWIGVKLLGLWILLIAVGSLFGVLESVAQYRMMGFLLDSDLPTEVPIDPRSARSGLLGTAFVRSLQAAVYGCGAYWFLARTNSVVDRVVGSSMQRPPAA